MVAQKWECITQKTQERLQVSVKYLFDNHSTLILEKADLIPSLPADPLMSKFESDLSKLKSHMDIGRALTSLCKRCRDENSTEVLQALRELFPYLESNQSWIHESASSEVPLPAVADLARTLLDTSFKFSDSHPEISVMSAQCLGVIGCLDPNRIETVREKNELLLISNFNQANEAIDFVTFILEHVLVKCFHSVSNTKAQGFLAYVMQELLKFCGFQKDTIRTFRQQHNQMDDTTKRWNIMSETTRYTLTPFLSSHYILRIQNPKPRGDKSYPIWSLAISHSTWLREFTFDLLQRPKGENAKWIFSVLSRVIRGYDLSISASVLPFAVANVILGGTKQEASDIEKELLAILKEPMIHQSSAEANNLKLCSENVFQCLDYLNRWRQEKSRQLGEAKSVTFKSGKSLNDKDEKSFLVQLDRVEPILSAIPADIIARRAMDCGSYARALLHWENHIRQRKKPSSTELSPQQDEDYLLETLQEIYAQIDDPDAVEGVSAHLHIIDPHQQAIEHRRAGRWTAAQSWYELQLQDDSRGVEHQTNLICTLQEAAQFHMVLREASRSEFQGTVPASKSMMSAIAQAIWSTGEWQTLNHFGSSMLQSLALDFNVACCSAMHSLKQESRHEYKAIIDDIRTQLSQTFTASSTASLQASHDQLFKLHTLYEIELLGGLSMDPGKIEKAPLQEKLARRLDVLGGSLAEKQYLLGIRRAAMELAGDFFDNRDIAESWLTTAKIARKSKAGTVAHDAVAHASKLGHRSAQIEQARLLWQDGEHRKAIKSLEGFIISSNIDPAQNSNATAAASRSTSFANATYAGTVANQPARNMMVAKANLLMAKWLDQGGQTQTEVILDKYRAAVNYYPRWEKGLYQLGKFYNKIFDSEKVLEPSRQGLRYLNGETAKLVIDQCLRSLVFGCKYLFQTLPKLLTIWLDFGDQILKGVPREVPDEIRDASLKYRPKMIEHIHKQLKKYADKILPYVFYPGLSQMISRIDHKNSQVFEVLAFLIVKVTTAYPQQALWSLLAVSKSSSNDRVKKGNNILNRVRERGKVVRNEGSAHDLRSLVSKGQSLSDELLRVCDKTIDGSRPSIVSLSRDLLFKTKVAPCPLVVPIEKTLLASLPLSATSSVQMKHHRAFPATREATTVSAFEDEVLVLSSLQRPRKITVIGSDGRRYGLLCKPNDDLRKDQRLMEFNAMINRSLKKDAESSKRRLSSKTYAVTPLNEACGLIEWVEGLKPLRDILVALYRTRNIRVDYNLLREMLNDASTSPKGGEKFTNGVLDMYPSILHTWFTDHFPAPEAWLAARTRYARSCAVTSMVGYALGLGDRHGENVLLVAPPASGQQLQGASIGGGSVFHVDFNCLFDKGLTFEKPEVVPFRLTHNMVDAFGATGVEGAFRRCAELTMGAMRANEDALLTILETFVYDPTADFVTGPTTRKRRIPGVPETPKEVLDSVRGKVRGLLSGESLPLSVQGHVDALIRQATDPRRLCKMYIGWCAFL